MPPRIPHRRLVSAALVCLVITGCELRQEPAAASRGQRRWPAPLSRRLEAAAESASTAAPDTIAFVESCTAGRRLAAAAGKPLLLIFRAGWCRWSAAFTQQTLGDPEIIALSEQFVCVQVDADRDADICRRYAVTQFPTVLVLAADDSELNRRSGHTLAVDLQPLLQQALAAEQLATAPGGAAPEPATAAPAARAGRQIRTADAPTSTIGR